MKPIGTFRIGFPIDPGEDEPWEYVLVQSNSSRQHTVAWLIDTEPEPFEPSAGSGAVRAMKFFPYQELGWHSLHFRHVGQTMADRKWCIWSGNSATAACTLALMQDAAKIEEKAPVVLVSVDCTFSGHHGGFQGVELKSIHSSKNLRTDEKDALLRKWEAATQGAARLGDRGLWKRLFGYKVTPQPEPGRVIALVLFWEDAYLLSGLLRSKGLNVQPRSLARGLLNELHRSWEHKPTLVSIHPDQMPMLAVELGVDPRHFITATAIAAEGEPDANEKAQTSLFRASDMEPVSANIIQELGLESLSDKKKIQMLDQMSSVVQKRVGLRVLERLDAASQQEFMDALEEEDQDKVSKILSRYGIDMLQIVSQEVEKMKFEMKNVVFDINRKIRPLDDD